MTKDIIKNCREKKAEIETVEKSIKNVSSRKQEIAESLSSIEQKISDAEKIHKKSLENAALGTGAASATKDSRNNLLELNQERDDLEGMLKIVTTQLETLKHELGDLRQNLNGIERALWKGITTDLAAKIKDAVGEDIKKYFIAARFGNVPITGNFLFDLFGNVNLTPSETESLRTAILKELEI